MKLIANRKFEEAIEVIREANPFPAVCGRVCTRPCEDVCELGVNGDSVAIRALKRYASDYELARRSIVVEPCEIIYKEKIAIIGAGPAGLTAAVDLIRLGYPVTVFEAEKEPGGMLRYAIPPYRLPDRVLKREIDWIKGLGIKIKTNQKIKDPNDLFKKGFSAVLIAGGAPKSFPLGIEGEKAEGVIDALKFLKQVNERELKRVKGKVVVIGGGSTAFDAARSSIRLQADKVTLAYRRSIEEMPAEKEEIEAAKKEGVEIVTLSIPTKIIKENNKVTGIQFLKAKLGEPDKSGRRRPVPIKNSEFTINADIIIPAVGAMPDIGEIGGAKVTTAKGVVDVKEFGKTIVDGVFAAGDVEMGPSSVVEAIGRGHEAARGIHAYLKKILPEEKTEELIKSIQIYLGSPICSKALHFPKTDIKPEKLNSFEEIEESYNDFQAVEEASRCFTCGPCYACPVCLPNCKNKQLVAKIQDTHFLVKSPQELSKEITEKEPVEFTLKTDEFTKKMRLYSLTSKVNPELCIGCGRCEEVCAYRAIKNIVSKDKRTISQVAHDSCASCAACVSECPSGAISQGFMSDKDILKRLDEKKTPYPGIKGLMSYWSTSSPIFGSYDGIVELMSTRKPSPMFLIRALARSGRGLLVVKPDEATGSHYLPWEESPDEVLKKTWNLLRLIGILPDRIQYMNLPKGERPSNLLKDFNEKLDKKKIGMLNISIPEAIESPFGEAIVILRILGANSDESISDKFSYYPAVKANGVAFFEGCIPLLHFMGKAHNLYDLSQTRDSIRGLLNELNIDVGSIKGFSCPSRSLLEYKMKEMENVVSRISEKNLKAYEEAKPKELILGTPESYDTFSKDKDYKKISKLVDVLLKKAEKIKDFKPINLTIALHPACNMEKDPFYDSAKKLLGLIPGLKIVELKSKCGHNSFDKINGESKEFALKLMNEAANKGAKLVICTSPNCESHLLMCHREGSWRSVDIEISDVYRLLYSSLTGEF